jgi:hypothetical protein
VKKFFITAMALAVTMSSCLPMTDQPAGETPTPVPEAALQATAAILSAQTLEALPSPLPSASPVAHTPTPAETSTETPNPFLLTLTATLGTGTVTAETPGGFNAAALTSGTLPFTGTPGSTQTSRSPTTPQPLTHGTLPPYLPYGIITIYNKAEAEAYISLRCVTSDGNVTILEYPVKKSVTVQAPSGKYTYVAWVGGRQFTGSFSMPNDEYLTITLYRDRVAIKK